MCGATSIFLTVLTMVGLTEYGKRTNIIEDPITAKLEPGMSMNHFIGYNHSVVANEQNGQNCSKATLLATTYKGRTNLFGLQDAPCPQYAVSSPAVAEVKFSADVSMPKDLD